MPSYFNCTRCGAESLITVEPARCQRCGFADGTIRTEDEPPATPIVIPPEPSPDTA